MIVLCEWRTKCIMSVWVLWDEWDLTAAVERKSHSKHQMTSEDLNIVGVWNNVEIISCIFILKLERCGHWKDCERILHKLSICITKYELWTKIKTEFVNILQCPCYTLAVLTIVITVIYAIIRKLLYESNFKTDPNPIVSTYCYLILRSA